MIDPLAQTPPRGDKRAAGWVAEWFKAAVLKTAVGASSPWVRIPPHPPFPDYARRIHRENHWDGLSLRLRRRRDCGGEFDAHHGDWRLWPRRRPCRHASAIGWPRGDRLRPRH